MRRLKYNQPEALLECPESWLWSGSFSLPEGYERVGDSDEYCILEQYLGAPKTVWVHESLRDRASVTLDG